MIGVLFAGLSTIVYASSEVSTAKGVEGTAKYESMSECIRPTAWMRRNHMDFIKHQRNKTVREGIRVRKDSLAGCIDCHVRKDENHQHVPVNAKGEFCDKCHSYVAESLPCFQCHATTPTAENP